MKTNKINRILQSPTARIIIGLLVCLLTVIIAQKIFIIIPGINSINADQRNLYKGIIVSILLIIVYRLFYKKTEKRNITELSTKGFGKSIISGMIIGIVLQGLTMTFIYRNADFNVFSVKPLTSAILPLTVAFTLAIIEEVLLRGIVIELLKKN
jgi:membrane protease YdiL (CAAX protease family)